ncbi:MAG: RnfABCDGE type electron transport complex subunit G [Bacteroidales bacterium]|nr:RnfABCDGE type electron transport complex subunit G [Bacteroidales bacterium]NPV35753.1 RnfABCDGE type electron transport complex subunit G [Bacteroidales bacterium]
MAKRESSLKNMISTLLVITLVASAALAGVYNLTKEPIAAATKKKTENAIKEVIPPFDRLERFAVMPSDGPDSLILYKGYKGDSIVGTAVQTYTYKGFSGYISIMVGFNADGSINDIAVLEHKETPGLGTKMAEPKFKDQFKNLNIAQLTNQKVKVTKDQGTIEAITAATISSRAFCDAVQRAWENQKKGGEK